MRHVLLRRPSGAMVVAIIALIVAASGTAVAATKMISGDKLIIKNSLSANRLRKQTLTGSQIKPHSLTAKQIRAHTLTGTQINLSRLGEVNSAKNADHATAATTATAALNASNASNAAELSGQPAEHVPDQCQPDRDERARDLDCIDVRGRDDRVRDGASRSR